MEISGIKSNVKAGSLEKKKKSGGASFSEFLSASDAAANESPAVNGMVNVNNLFLLQEDFDEPQSKKQSIEHGFDILAYLENIRNSLLTGKISREVLYGLEDKIKNWQKNAEDPALMNVLDEIELRAAVEIAKLEFASS